MVAAWRSAAVLALLYCASGDCLRVGVFTRRDVATAALFSLPALQQAAEAAEPEPAKILTEEEMAARVARKQELLKNQGRKGKTDTKIMYGADFQMGKRESKNEKTNAGVGGFLLPGDVGGLNLGNPFTGSAPSSSR